MFGGMCACLVWMVSEKEKRRTLMSPWDRMEVIVKTGREKEGERRLQTPLIHPQMRKKLAIKEINPPPTEK